MQETTSTDLPSFSHDQHHSIYMYICCGDTVIVSNCSSLMLWILQLHKFWMKECNILRGSKHTLTFLHIFGGVRTPPGTIRPWWATRAVDDQSWGGQREWAVIYDCRRRVTCTHILEFCLGHDNFKPSGAAKALIGGHCMSAWSWSDIMMVGSIVSISKISEVKYAVKLAVIQRVLNERMTFLGEGGQNILTPPTFFSGESASPNPQDLRPWQHYGF